MTKQRLYGLLAEFDNRYDLLDAARGAHAAGYRKLDAYTPFPIHGLAQAIGYRHTLLPKLVFLGGLLGAVGGFGLLYWATVIEYPMNISGKPHNSWPAYIPITFETTVLAAAVTVVLGMLALNGLPMPHHPLFNAPRFALASRDRFFLCIEARDPKFDLDQTRRFLESVHAKEVVEVER